MSERRAKATEGEGNSEEHPARREEDSSTLAGAEVATAPNRAWYEWERRKHEAKYPPFEAAEPWIKRELSKFRKACKRRGLSDEQIAPALEAQIPHLRKAWQLQNSIRSALRSFPAVEVWDAEQEEIRRRAAAARQRDDEERARQQVAATLAAHERAAMAAYQVPLHMAEALRQAQRERDVPQWATPDIIEASRDATAYEEYLTKEINHGRRAAGAVARYEWALAKGVGPDGKCATESTRDWMQRQIVGESNLAACRGVMSRDEFAARRRLHERRELINSLQGGRPVDAAKYVRAGSLAAATAQSRWLIDGLLPRGLSLFHAPPETWKSLCSLLMLICLRTGLPFLGRFRVPRILSRVAYVTAEDDGDLVIGRLKGLAAGLDIELPDGIDIYVLQGSQYVSMDDCYDEAPPGQRFFRRLEQRFAEQGTPAYVVVEPLRSFTSRAEGIEWSPIAVEARQFMRRTSLLGLQFGHHDITKRFHTGQKVETPRVSDVASGNLLIGSVDWSMALKTVVQDRRVRVHVDKAKGGGRPAPFLIDGTFVGTDIIPDVVRLTYSEPETPPAKVATSSPARRAATPKDDALRTDILAFVGGHPRCTQNAVEEAVPRRSKAVREALKFLVAQGLLIRETAGQRYLYSVTTP